MLIHVLVLNYNGRRLLAKCLPSVLEAARASRHRCEVAVIDNDSRDVSVPWLGEHFPQVRIICRPNRGLCSFNDVVPSLRGPVAVLLNNDIKLASDSIDPLVEPLLEPERNGHSPCFMTAPLCWDFDGGYEGLRTAVRWRWGLVQATALFPGHEAGAGRPGLTASAGAAMAVDRRKFTELGGFDPVFLPGRLEDLDFAFRGFLAGYHARYVPAAVTWHRGMATFGAVYGPDACDLLALRNTLLFQWKNLRTPGSFLRQALGLPLRLLLDQLRAPVAGRAKRWAFTRALFGALARAGRWHRAGHPTTDHTRREREFFGRFAPGRMRADAGLSTGEVETFVAGDTVSLRDGAATPRAHAATPPAQHLTVELENTNEVVEIHA